VPVVERVDEKRKRLVFDVTSCKVCRKARVVFGSYNLDFFVLKLNNQTMSGRGKGGKENPRFLFNLFSANFTLNTKNCLC
jgi:hypothetical protein